MPFFRRFSGDEDGSTSIELVLVMPILVWVLLSTYVFFDAFYNKANARRSALTIADMFSREQSDIDAQYMDGARDLMRFLTRTNEDPGLRVTTYEYSASNETYRVIWSRKRNLGDELTTADLKELDSGGRLPTLADGDVAILVETHTHYSAPFSVGLGVFMDTSVEDMTFETFTVIRPRFVSSLCYDTTPSKPGGEIC